PVFLGLRGGLGRLAQRLGERLAADPDADVVCGTAARTAEPTGDGRLRLTCEPGVVLVDAAVLTVPAFAAAPIVGAASPDAGRDLEGVAYASVAIVTLGYSFDAAPRALDGSGFLVPRADGR